MSDWVVYGCYVTLYYVAGSSNMCRVKNFIVFTARPQRSTSMQTTIKKNKRISEYSSLCCYETIWCHFDKIERFQIGTQKMKFRASAHRRLRTAFFFIMAVVNDVEKQEHEKNGDVCL